MHTKEQQEHWQARVQMLGGLAELSEPALGTVVETLKAPSALNGSLDSLVKKGSLKAGDARSLRLANGLLHVLDEQVELARAVKARGDITELKHLAALSDQDWLDLVQASEVKPPEGTTAADYAATLSRRVASLYPTDALLARVVPADTGDFQKGLKRVASRLAKTDFRKLRTTGLAAGTKRTVRSLHADITRFVNRFPGLGVEEIINDPSLPLSSKLKQIDEQVGLLSKVRAHNPDVDLIRLDYSPDSADLETLKFTGVPAAARPRVLKILKAYQRTYTLTNDAADSSTILEAGYHSAASIARDDLETFTRKTGLSSERAARYYETARSTAGAVTAMMGTVLDLYLNGVLPLAVDNTVVVRPTKQKPPKKIEGKVEPQPSVDDYLKRMDGYAELFGSQNYCCCEHCQSILSPAAYFVDLMSFVEKKVLNQVFTGSKQNHVLNLKSRRPDLWSLELTCKNTNDTIPTLDIANEILENYIALKSGYTGDLKDRAKVGDKVYREKLAQSVKSFRQPMVLPLETARIYLDFFERPRAQVARTLEAAPDVIARAALNLPLAEYSLLTAANTMALTSLRDLYGINFTAAANGSIQPFDAQLLLKPMAVTREELGQLLETKYVSQNGAAKAEIKPEKTSSNSVQNDMERIRGLTATILDRLHRFTRLWRQVPWSITELDLVLTQLGAASLATGITHDALKRISEILPLQTRFNAPVEQVASLWSPLPRNPAAKDVDSLFDRLFNFPPYTPAAVRYPQNGTQFTHPSFNPTTTGTDSGLNRLLAGLQVSDSELLQLITGLAVPLGVNLTATTAAAKSFALSLENLTLLHRHARLSEWLEISVSDLFQTIAHAGIAAGHIVTMDDLTTLLRFHDWRVTAPYSLDALGFITGGRVQKPDAYPDKQAIVTELVNGLKADRSLEFAASVLAFEGITEDQSRRILQDNSTAFEALPDGSSYRLKPAFSTDLSVQLTIHSSIAGTAADKKKVSDRAKTALLKHHASSILPDRLTAKLGLSREQTDALIRMTGVDLSSSAIVLGLQGSGATTALVNIAGQLLSLGALFAQSVFDREAIDFVAANPGIFGITSFATLDLASVRLLSAYVMLAGPSPDDKFTADLVPVDPADVRTALKAFNPTQKKFVNVDAELARVLRTEAGAITALQASIPLAATASESLLKLKHTLALAHDLGLGADTLPAVVSDTYTDLARASDALQAAVHAKYPDEKEYRDRIDPFEDRIRSKRRDGLTDYLLHSEFPQFTATSDLYRYFLIDCDMEGCARTSRVVSAVSSVQLYVHRCLMNLEQDNHTPPDVRVAPERIPRDEWEWRKNYRVWEANRKVFLYPENYIEPGLRDDKSELFQELEDTLLKQEVKEQNVLDAFGTYLSGLDGLANLAPAGGYLESTSDGDRLHLFAVSSDDPPIYYHRTADLLEAEKPGFSHWTRMNVQIPVRRVSPVMCLGRMYVFWVEVSTRSKTDFDDGKSIFWGYIHKLSVSYSMLRLDGTWSAPQKLAIKYAEAEVSGAALDTTVTVPDPLDEGEAERLTFNTNIPYIPAIVVPTTDTKIPRYDFIQHAEAIEGYTLRGEPWELVYPSVKNGRLYLTLRNFRLAGEVDLGRNRLNVIQPPATLPSESQSVALYLRHIGNGPNSDLLEYTLPVYSGSPAPLTANAARGLLTLSTRVLGIVNLKDRGISGLENFIQQFNPGILAFTTGSAPNLAQVPAASVAMVVSGRKPDLVVTSGFDSYLIHRLDSGESSYRAHRLGTGVGDQLRVNLGIGGIEELLKTSSQIKLTESQWVVPQSNYLLATGSQDPFAGAYQGYLQEIFFHIPSAIANHMNGQQDFAGAQRWYHYIFDPTSSETTTPPQDRNWRYLPLRKLGWPKLKDLLTDQKTIDAYVKDPLNPHVIARSRLSAYQKNLVMKYVDNLLDWGDTLFSRFTMESVNEAIMLYVMAADILGPRPAPIGSCGEGQLTPKTYDTIKSHLSAGSSDFLLELETVSNSPMYKGFRLLANGNGVAVSRYAATAGDSAVSPDSYPSRIKRRASGNAAFIGSTVTANGNYGSIGGFGPSLSLVEQIGPAFCVPANPELTGYWDRVEDRLFKIRHCMDINGVPRQLALFAPEIDPRLLVRAKAAGLSLEDVLNATSGNLPPYRFTYLIEKAKAYATSVASLGGSLTAALEKKDVEELTRLRTIHEQRISRLTREVREQEVKDTDASIGSLERQQEAAQYRRDYYLGLRGTGLSEWERTQQIAQHTQSSIYLVEATLGLLSGIFHLIPDIGSPFAMKYGGTQTGESVSKIAIATGALAAIAGAVAASAGLEASFQRRAQDWEHQANLADRELKQIAKQLESAKIRKIIAEKSLAIQEKTIQQNEEMFELQGSKFSNLGLYTWLSTTLQRLYREAYNSAFAVARLAEQAYRFERWDDGYQLGTDYWDSSRAGLLAGERLLVELENLERRFIETNYRTPEIEQSFSLTQISPAALVRLRETGSCQFSIPEIFFDLAYPGQYRRKIRAIKLTVPCVTGPYTNVGATLALVESQFRNEPKVGPAFLKTMPPTRSVIIASSKAQNDAGVFEFSFRDERYMPFEGAGAVSTWKLSLPKSFRPFDYQSISDVILHLSYTAEQDELLRQKVEESTAAVESELLKYFKGTAVSRVFSLRHEFPTEFHRLLHSAAGTEITVQFADKHFPLFLQGRRITVDSAKLGIRTAEGQALGSFKIAINGSERSSFAADADLGNLPTNKTLSSFFAAGKDSQLKLAIKNPGSLNPTPPVAGDPSAVSSDKLLDLLLYLEYRVKS